jgi:hypothetical protein
MPSNIDPKNCIPKASHGPWGLKSLKIAEFASEETLCYEAIIVENGKPVFRGRNDGHGGSDFYEPLVYSPEGRKMMEEALARLEAYAKALPPIESHGIVLDHDAESLIGSLAESARMLKKMKRAAKSKVLIFDPAEDKPGESYQVLKVAPSDPRLPAYLAKHPNLVLLNEAVLKAE